MVLRVCKYGEAILRRRTPVVTQVTDGLRRLAADMIETMHKAKGVGLAAPQVGRSERLCVIDIPSDCETDEDAVFNAPIPMPLTLVNPEILSQEGSVCDKEGCLSFPGIGGKLTRAEQVVVQYVDLDNQPQMLTARGYLARAIQHETDHLNGVLYIDHMTAVERLGCSGKLKKLAAKNGGVR